MSDAAIATTRLRSPLTGAVDAELERLVNSGNDLQNAAYFARFAGRHILFDATSKMWLIFEGGRWMRDDKNAVIKAAKGMAHQVLRIGAALATDDRTREAYVKYGTLLSGRRKIADMLELAKSELPATPDEFDRDPFVLNLENGTLDLRSGKIRPHSPDDRLTKIVPIAYDPTARAERFARFLREIFCDDDTLIDMFSASPATCSPATSANTSFRSHTGAAPTERASSCGSSGGRRQPVPRAARGGRDA